MGSKGFDWIDIAKGIAIFLVICGARCSKSFSFATCNLLLSYVGVLYSCRVYIQA